MKIIILVLLFALFGSFICQDQEFWKKYNYCYYECGEEYFCIEYCMLTGLLPYD